MDIEKALQEIAKSYEADGYLVITHPDNDHLPGFAKDFGIDLVASRGQERVAVQVKMKRSDLEKDPKLLEKADIIAKQPGWRLDLHLLEEDSALSKTAEKVGEP